MREILFRGKRRYTGEWAESVCPLGVMHSGHLCDDFETETVGQYTGLDDKNGKKIFEGDVIRFGNKNLRVLWNEECFCWYAMTGRFPLYYPESQEWNAIDIGWIASELPICGYISAEVIGNVYDNPQLVDWEGW